MKIEAVKKMMKIFLSILDSSDFLISKCALTKILFLMFRFFFVSSSLGGKSKELN